MGGQAGRGARKAPGTQKKPEPEAITVFNPLNDAVFKILLGSNPEFTIDFINSVLGLEGNTAIKNVVFLSDPERLGRGNVRIRAICEDGSGARILVEMQKHIYSSLANGWIYNAARNLVDESAKVHLAQESLLFVVRDESSICKAR